MAADVLTTEQIGQFHDAFRRYDRDSDGVVTSREIGMILRSIGQNPSEAEIQVRVDCRRPL